MRRIFIFFAIVLFVASITNAHGATYYIDYSIGSDSNNGLSKASPWKRHPFMRGYMGSYTHQAGDQFIFKGGVIWPNACFQMTIGAGGSVGNVDYYGVDATWYTGGAWTRPVFDLQYSVLSTGIYALYIPNGYSYITFDSLEIRNMLFAGSNVGNQALIYVSIVRPSGIPTNITFTNCYVHGWKLALGQTGNTSTGGGVLAGVQQGTESAAGEKIQFLNGEIGNDDGTYRSGVIIRGFETVKDSKLHDAPNVVLNVNYVIGNDIYNCWNSIDTPTTHENMIYNGSGVIAHNKIHGIEANCGTYFDPSWGPGNVFYIYNNLFYDYDGRWTSPQTQMGYTDGKIYMWNNTIDARGVEWCIIPSGTVQHLDARNNHCIRAGSDTSAVCTQGAGRCGGTVVNLTNEYNTVMSAATATAQGYTLSNLYKPTSLTNSTVNAGTSITCASCSPPVAQDILGISRPQGSAWDTGAYEFSFGPRPPDFLRIAP